MVLREDVLNLLAVDFRRFLYDNFQTTETIDDSVIQTGAVNKWLSEIELTTGIQEASTAKIHYNYAAFNPWYSQLFFKARLSSIENVFAFIGFKETTDNPTHDMTESHAGLMIYNGHVYFSTGNGDDTNPNQQLTEITGMDATNVLLYRIIFDKFAYRPTPLIYPYFDGIRVVKTERLWSNDYQNGTYTPINKDHYFMAYISNDTGVEKNMKINFVLYGEEYPD